MSEHGVTSYTSDQRLGETGWRLFDLNYERGLPYDLREGIALDTSSFYVIESDWSTKGAQEFPFGIVTIANETMDQILAGSNVFYRGGPIGEELVGFRSR